MEHIKYVVVRENNATNTSQSFLSHSFDTALSAAKSLAKDNDSEVAIYKSGTGKDCPIWKSTDNSNLKAYCELSHSDWETATEGFYQAELKELGINCVVPSVYIDIDGTLGKWYTDMRGYDYEDILAPETHYFRDVEPQTDVIEYAKALQESGVDVCIISAAAKDTIRDKWDWIEEHMPFISKENIFFAPLGADKSQFVKSNAEISVLVDDYQKNLDMWYGKGIKLLNGLNHYEPSYNYIDITNGYFDKEQAVKMTQEILVSGNQQILSDPQHGEEYNTLLDEREAKINEILKEAGVKTEAKEKGANTMENTIERYEKDDEVGLTMELDSGAKATMVLASDYDIPTPQVWINGSNSEAVSEHYDDYMEKFFKELKDSSEPFITPEIKDFADRTLTVANDIEQLICSAEFTNGAAAFTYNDIAIKAYLEDNHLPPSRDNIGFYDTNNEAMLWGAENLYPLAMQIANIDEVERCHENDKAKLQEFYDKYIYDTRNVPYVMLTKEQKMAVEEFSDRHKELYGIRPHTDDRNVCYQKHMENEKKTPTQERD